MNYNYTMGLAGNGLLAGLGAGLLSFIIVISLWSLVWKGFALWKSTKKGDKVWFIVFLVLNTAGILEIIYLLMNRSLKAVTPTQDTPNTI